MSPKVMLTAAMGYRRRVNVMLGVLMPHSCSCETRLPLALDDLDHRDRDAAVVIDALVELSASPAPRSFREPSGCERRGELLHAGLQGGHARDASPWRAIHPCPPPCPSWPGAPGDPGPLSRVRSRARDIEGGEATPDPWGIRPETRLRRRSSSAARAHLRRASRPWWAAWCRRPGSRGTGLLGLVGVFHLLLLRGSLLRRLLFGRCRLVFGLLLEGGSLLTVGPLVLELDPERASVFLHGGTQGRRRCFARRPVASSPLIEPGPGRQPACMPLMIIRHGSSASYFLRPIREQVDAPRRRFGDEARLRLSRTRLSGFRVDDPVGADVETLPRLDLMLPAAHLPGDRSAHARSPEQASAGAAAAPRAPSWAIASGLQDRAAAAVIGGSAGSSVGLTWGFSRVLDVDDQGVAAGEGTRPSRTRWPEAVVGFFRRRQGWGQRARSGGGAGATIAPAVETDRGGEVRAVPSIHLHLDLVSRVGYHVPYYPPRGGEETARPSRRGRDRSRSGREEGCRRGDQSRVPRREEQERRPSAHGAGAQRPTGRPCWKAAARSRRPVDDARGIGHPTPA